MVDPDYGGDGCGGSIKNKTTNLVNGVSDDDDGYCVDEDVLAVLAWQS